MDVLFSTDEIAQKIERIAAKINQDYADKHLVVLVLLDGAFVFAADLCRQIRCSNQIEFMKVSSYGSNTVSSGQVNVLLEVAEYKIHAKHVLLVDDICDSGQTLQHVKQRVLDMGASTVRTCVLLNKKHRRTAHVKVDYFGFTCPDRFVIGYGLDYQGEFRNGSDIRTIS